MATLKELTARVEALEAAYKVKPAVQHTLGLATDAVTFASPKEAMAAGKAAAVAGNRVRIQGNTVYYH